MSFGNEPSTGHTGKCVDTEEKVWKLMTFHYTGSQFSAATMSVVVAHLSSLWKVSTRHSPKPGTKKLKTQQRKAMHVGRVGIVCCKHPDLSTWKCKSLFIRLFASRFHPSLRQIQIGQMLLWTLLVKRQRKRFVLNSETAKSVCQFYFQSYFRVLKRWASSLTRTQKFESRVAS